MLAVSLAVVQLHAGGCSGLLLGQSSNSQAFLRVADPHRLRGHLSAALARPAARDLVLGALEDALADSTLLRRALLPMEVTRQVRSPNAMGSLGLGRQGGPHKPLEGGWRTGWQGKGA
jgi:hypothetical protein